MDRIPLGGEEIVWGHPKDRLDDPFPIGQVKDRSVWGRQDELIPRGRLCRVIGLELMYRYSHWRHDSLESLEAIEGYPTSRQRAECPGSVRLRMSLGLGLLDVVNVPDGTEACVPEQGGKLALHSAKTDIMPELVMQ